ncbi:MAG: FecR domain-containing protein, partial [Pseudomonadota bacterium]
LGADSAITVSIKNGQRAVGLLQGEAFFKVVRDENRPFIVSHGSTRTRVLGTEFEVRETGEGTEVSVVEGAVEVAAEGPAGGGQRLSAGRRIRMGDTDEKIQESEAVETAEVAAWRRGELIVDDWTLRQVVDTLDRHYGGTILFDGRSTGKRRISGAYKLDKPVDAVRLIARAQNLNVRELTDWLVVLTPY